jgi:hypothetical protein
MMLPLLVLGCLLTTNPHGAQAQAGLTLFAVRGHQDYAAWMAAAGWADLRPFSRSARRFRFEGDALRLESRGDSYLIGTTFPPAERRPIADFPYLRFVVRIGAVPEGARLMGEVRDDAAFRLYAGFADDPPRSLVYVWSWDLPVGAWSPRAKHLWGDFRDVRRKAFGQGVPPAGWLTVEVNLLQDFREQFPHLPPPPLRGLALKSDSNHTPDGHSLAWLREVTLHRESLREQGLEEGAALGDTTLWYR